MSNAGQAVSALVGGVIGFLVGGPTGALYGFEIGLLAGTVISPTQLPGTSGPRLTDGKTTTASIGDAVAFGYGFFTVGGTVVYLGTCIEHSSTTSSSSKGAPTQTQTTYSYTQTIAIGLCEGPIDDIYRIWENGELVYDVRPQMDGESDTAYGTRLNASIPYRDSFVKYFGTETQLPDPTIEADKGVGNVPAFRGLSYVVYPDRKLRDDQGQRHPTFKFEIHVGPPDYNGLAPPTNLEDIVTAICGRCGYDTVSQIDASALASTIVVGYSIQAVMAGRDALTPLKSVGLFDCVESGTKLRFTPRGAAALRTMDASDLGVYDGSSENDDPDPAVSVTEKQDVELPRQVRVHYISADTDYLAGQQLSPSRFDTDAVNDLDIELAVCISDTQALQIAEILWNDAWQSRYTYTTTVDQSNADIEPSDVLIVPLLGTNYRMRVDKVSDASQILRKLTLISDDNGAYVSSAVAPEQSRPVQTLGVTSGSVLVLLDLPALQDTDNDAGFYAVAYGDGTGNKWTGTTIYKSTDGDTFTQKATVSGSPPLGHLGSDLGVGITDTWDDSNFLDVVPIKGEFDSRTDDAVLAGANTLAVGADGRWEIVQFGTATLLTDTAGTFYRLTHLLRGRRGTEWAVGKGVAGDMVVGLTMGALYRISMQNSEIGALEHYKAVTIGDAYDTGVDQDFTGRGVALKPFSPCHVRGGYSGSDFVITWIRRDRLGQEFSDGVETAMSEATESYSVDILTPGSPSTVLRTLASATPTVTYTSSQITSDFGSPPTHIHVKVYQISAVVGRGYPAEATVP